MSKYSVLSESVISPQLEAQSIELERILSVKGSQAKLVGANGEKITIPEPIYQVLLQVVHAMASGKAISIIPQQQELTTQQAAEYLNVSRPYLIKLLEQGDINYIKVGSHRRVRFDDLMKYKQHRDTKRREGLKEFTQFLQDEGFYDEESSKLD
ncbi:DNA-binding protein [Nostoc sp. KVJ20]|uniref:helix-turn-helix domain-containing protein n=1 Tax=Nostoc sp. KVJ20 TaxID=457944 RepID=UPI00083E003A|nr:helix-turn-helix domain-containing protein [Nostoc sp. KVJ20]ODG96410.1 DNA-binding protein [Nostoc sp. KVJ20]